MKLKTKPCVNCGHSKCSHGVNLYYQKICKPNCGCKKYSLTETDVEFLNKWHKAGWEDGIREERERSKVLEGIGKELLEVAKRIRPEETTIYKWHEMVKFYQKDMETIKKAEELLK